MTTETVFLNSGLAFVREALVTEVPVTISAFKIGSASNFIGDSDATDVSGALVYTGAKAQVASSEDIDGNLVFTLTLGENVGSFTVGNLVLIAADAGGGESRPLIHVILPHTVAKTATVGENPGNTLAFRITVNVIDGTATTEVTITVANENIGVLPSVADESHLPAPGPSAYQHYVVQALTSTNAPALALRRVSDNTWWGNGFVNRIDDHRFGWVFGGFAGDAYAIKTNATTFGGFFGMSDDKFTTVVDGGADWAVGTSILDGGTWS